MSLLAIIVGICILVLIFLLLNSVTYWNTSKILNKEEMFQFTIDNQEALNEIVDEMIKYYGEETAIVLYRNDGKMQKPNNIYNLFKNFSVSSIAINNINENERLGISFAYVPKGYDYWGIYYSQTGEAANWGGEAELVEIVEGIYTQIGSYYKYETEKIIGNWYYYQCDTR